ncbi:unnamed protein product [Polarella glacialis]|uniref:DNA helicase n=1 Tax=Polarella glacialis TaxID=89957 RepID=A0A813I7T4_POLGL|nr:unnamed protein product [Polarella glacialis]CAE8646199.1 unnamed protein product [Polarella glacialis]
MEKKAPTMLRLKLGAQVIFIKNLPNQGISNRSSGIIVGGEGDGRCPMVRCDCGRTVLVEHASCWQGGPMGAGALCRQQLLLKLAWALTARRAQGATLSRAELQLQNAFDYGQVYVAQSRLKSLQGLWITGQPVTQREVRAHPQVLAFYGLT